MPPPSHCRLWGGGDEHIQISMVDGCQEMVKIDVHKHLFRILISHILCTYGYHHLKKSTSISQIMIDCFLLTADRVTASAFALTAPKIFLEYVAVRPQFMSWSMLTTSIVKQRTSIYGQPQYVIAEGRS
jgi:hypothetical protein